MCRVPTPGTALPQQTLACDWPSAKNPSYSGGTLRQGPELPSRAGGSALETRVQSVYRM